jgi:formylglycine-generating enzyme required for sulfatase activity
MKVTAVLASFLAVASLNAAKVEQVIVRQQWPWSTDVKVEYKLSGVNSPVDISVKAYNGDVELDSSQLASAMTGERYRITESGVGTIVIDPVRAFGTSKVALANFKVKLTLTESVPEMDEVIYKIFDVATGVCEKNITRADLLNGKYGAVETDFSRIGPGFNTTLEDVLIWTGVTNYPGVRTTKLVMRKIPVGGKPCIVGCPTDEMGCVTANDRTPQETIVMPEDYWMSVFELTVGQALSIKSAFEGKNLFKNEECYNERPMHCLAWTNIRCDKVDTYTAEVGNKSLIGILRSRTGLNGWDLPNTNEWEVACRAGTTTGLNSGKNLTARDALCPNLNEVSRNYYNSGTKDQGYSWETCGATQGLAPVGSYAPNAFGLYDMHGNALEWTLDRKSSSGSIPSAYQRGGSYDNSAIRSCRSSYSSESEKCNYDTRKFGCRLILKFSEE